MRSGSATVLQQYHPWPGTVGFTLSSDPLSVPAPGQCLLVGKATRNGPLLTRPAMPSNFNPRSNTLDVLLQLEHVDAEFWSGVRRDDTLHVTGPIGRPFQLDRKVRRALLVDDGSAVAPLLYFVHHLVEQMVEVTYVALTRDANSPVPASALPPEIEYLAVHHDGLRDLHVGLAAEIDRLLPWADSLYLAMGGEHLSIVLGVLRRGLMRLRKGFAQAIVVPDLLPCGVGACDLCTIVTRDGYRRICRDGLVFDLLSLS